MSYSSRDSCSPSRNNKHLKGGSPQSCFSYQSLARIARRYNESNPSSERIPLYRNRDQLWKAIRAKIPQCNNERCWIRSRWLNKDDQNKLLEDFKPPIPQGKYTWLNTDDINQVLKGYERVFPNFQYLGTHPIDFYDIYPEMFAPLNVSKLKRAGKKKAGLVLNLDNSDQPGSHWVAVLLDLENNVVEFFDSYGEDPPKEVKELYQRLNKRSKKGWKLRVNRTIHQQKNSECGVYAIHFIVRRISGTSFKQASNEVIRDAAMNKKRHDYSDPHFSK